MERVGANMFFYKEVNVYNKYQIDDLKKIVFKCKFKTLEKYVKKVVLEWEPYINLDIYRVFFVNAFIHCNDVRKQQIKELSIKKNHFFKSKLSATYKCLF